MSDGIENSSSGEPHCCGECSTLDKQYELATKALRLLFPNEQVMLVWAGQGDDDVNVLGHISSDAIAVALLTRAVMKVYSRSEEKDSLPMTMIPITDPNLN